RIFIFSGIRFWDLRKTYFVKTTVPVPARLIMPPKEPKEGAGITSFCTEPFTQHTLYATCTDNIIYAYSLSSMSANPGKNAIHPLFSYKIFFFQFGNTPALKFRRST